MKSHLLSDLDVGKIGRPVDSILIIFLFGKCWKPYPVKLINVFLFYSQKRTAIQPITFEGGAKKSKSGDQARYAPPSGKFSDKAGTYNPGRGGGKETRY